MLASVLAASNAIGLNWLAAILIVAVGVAGVFVLLGEGIKSLIGWAFVALSVALLIEFCATWSRTIHA